jgi:hypothetical protein
MNRTYRPFDHNAVPLVSRNLEHQIKLSNSGGALLVSCNCSMPPIEFHPEKGDDPRDIYVQWHEEAGK